jgi:AhpD family alkylhydroperoxidase
MKPIVQVIPESMAALQALAKSAEHSGVAPVTFKLMQLRASQMNGCSVCVDMHSRQLARAGESSERIYTVAAWRDAPYFTEAERAALALTEAVTKCDVPDEVWDEAARHYNEQQLAALVIDIANINAWNRLNIATRQVSGAWTAAY